MIFKPELVDLILAGRKTQTRRPVNFDNPRSHYWHEGLLYEPGRVYALQPGRGQKAVGQIEVVEVWREFWKDITEEDAIAEGFERGWDEDQVMRPALWFFWQYVCDLYPRGDWMKDECWAIEFQLLEVDR